jgi:hypothetical protein
LLSRTPLILQLLLRRRLDGLDVLVRQFWRLLPGQLMLLDVVLVRK